MSEKERRESLLEIILLFSLTICLLVSAIFNILAHSQIDEKLKNLEQNKADRVCHTERKDLSNLTEMQIGAKYAGKIINVECDQEGNIYTHKNGDVSYKIKNLPCKVYYDEKICEIK